MSQEAGQERQLDDKERRELLSVTMSLMYIARLTRPDILFAVTHLASRSHCATASDQKEALHIVRHLEKTKELHVVINCTSLDLRIYADASLTTHADGKGHSGFSAHLGLDHSYLHARSNKQKLTATSSSESELYALSDATKYGMWARGLIDELHLVPLSRITIMQDNKSTIMMVLGQANTKNSKHFIRRLYFVCEAVAVTKIHVPYCPTDLMVADILTKALTGIAQERHRHTLLGLRNIERVGGKRDEYSRSRDPDAQKALKSLEAEQGAVQAIARGAINMVGQLWKLMGFGPR